MRGSEYRFNLYTRQPDIGAMYLLSHIITPCLAEPQPQGSGTRTGPSLGGFIHTVEYQIVDPIKDPKRILAHLQIFEVKFANR